MRMIYEDGQFTGERLPKNLLRKLKAGKVKDPLRDILKTAEKAEQEV